MSIMCLLGYAVFGPSRILVLGLGSSLRPMIAATIESASAAFGQETGAEWAVSQVPADPTGQEGRGHTR
jgi:hypothetical protein